MYKSYIFQNGKDTKFSDMPKTKKRRAPARLLDFVLVGKSRKGYCLIKFFVTVPADVFSRTKYIPEVIPETLMRVCTGE